MKKIIIKVKNKLKYIKEMFLSKITYYSYKKKVTYNILDDDLVIGDIIKNRKSLARFGDGEFKWILDIPQDSFQVQNQELSKKLIECLKSKNDKLLIGIPKPLKELKEYNKFAKKTWKYFIYLYGFECYNLIPKNRKYADTNITRFYMDYKNKNKVAKRIQSLKLIWNEREIIIVEGSKTKLGVGNDLFDNAKAIQRIIAPNKNAFDKFEEIYKTILEQSNEKLILLSLGPTATILAYELCKKGYQAIDIGHIDIEYEWFKRKAKKKVPINGKFVNEAKQHGDYSEIKIEDERYIKSIIKTITN